MSPQAPRGEGPAAVAGAREAAGCDGAGGAEGGARWALLVGNLAVGCGVMVVPGAMNDLARGLEVSVAAAGQLVTAGAWAMALGAPLLAAWLSAIDRRAVLAAALVWFAAGHLLCALLPGLAALLPARAATVLGAAVFTPAAAAAASMLVPEHRRGEAIAFVFLGWSLASVAGMPLASYLSETLGWRAAFVFVAGLAGAAALGVWRQVPAGLKAPALSLGGLAELLRRPLPMAMVVVTALSATGQFTLFGYMAPYYHQVLRASATEVSLLFMWFGLFGLAGSLLLTRWIDRLGAGRAATIALVAMASSLIAWPLAHNPWAMALVLVPWALGCFSSNSAQQARLVASAPAWAGVLVALNSSAMYLGQGIGAGAGGLLLEWRGYPALAPAAAAAMLLAAALSAVLVRRGPRAGAGPR